MNERQSMTVDLVFRTNETWWARSGKNAQEVSARNAQRVIDRAEEVGWPVTIEYTMLGTYPHNLVGQVEVK